MYSHDLEVIYMSSSPDGVELGVRGTSVLSCTWIKNIILISVFLHLSLSLFTLPPSSLLLHPSSPNLYPALIVSSHFFPIDRNLYLALILSKIQLELHVLHHGDGRTLRLTPLHKTIRWVMLMSGPFENELFTKWAQELALANLANCQMLLRIKSDNIVGFIVRVLILLWWLVISEMLTCLYKHWWHMGASRYTGRKLSQQSLELNWLQSNMP